MLLLCSILLCLQACAQPVKVEAAKPVIVTKTQYVALPKELTAACEAPTPRKEALQTVGSVLAAYIHDSTALIACAAQVDGIRALQH